MNKRNRITGFSLIELMVTVLIVSILVGIAVPSYMNSVRKSRRTEARSALVDLQAREERFYTTNPSVGYTQLAANLGYAASGATTDMSAGQTLQSGNYSVAVVVSQAVPLPPTTPAAYTITASSVSGTDQYKDTSCRAFTLDQNGVQGATDSTGASTATVASNCWK